jgi:hypothetical protein
MAIYDIKTFDRGINNFIDPGFIQKNQSQKTENAKISDGNLTSLNGLTMLNEILIKNPEDLDHYGASNRSMVNFLDNDYWSINDAVAAPYYGGQPANYLGVEYPSAPPTVAAGAAGALTGDYKYAITFLNGEGWESAPGDTAVYWSTVTLASQQADISIPAFPTGTATCIIYRTVAAGSEFYEVARTASPSSTYSDNLTDDLLLLGNPLDTVNDLPPPDGGKYLTEQNNTFFLVVGDRVYFSKQGNPHAWNPLDFVNLNDTGTGLVEEFEGILAFTSNSTTRITGYDVLTVSSKLLPSNQGCKNWRTVSRLDDVPIWESNDGLCIWDGSSIKLVSHELYEISFTSTHAEVYDDAYYLFHPNGATVYDRRTGGTFTELSNFVGSTYNEYAWYDGDADKLYLYNGLAGDDGRVYEYGTGTAQEVDYISPHVDGGLTEKSYRRIWLRNDSTTTVKFFVEGTEVMDVDVLAGERFIYLPAGSDGRYAYFELIFTGTVFDAAIEYEEVLL